MRIARTRSALLVVDVQERLLPAMSAPDALLDRLGLVVAAARALAVPVVATEQYPKGIGPTVAAVREAMGPDARVFEKTHFSGLSEPEIEAALRALRNSGRAQIVMAGIEAHVCVLQTALEARERGYDVFVVADAVDSRKAASRERGLSRLAAAGCAIVDAEMCAFEWLGRAGTAEFRAVHALIK